MKSVFTIFKRELASYLNSPTAYIVAIAFIVPSYFMFWQSTLMSGQAAMRDYFNLWPWFLMLLAPALTMRLLTEEKRRQTLDLLLAHPVKEWQVVAGKFLAAWAFLSGILMVTMTLPLTVSRFSNFDWSQAIAQYIGAILIGGACLALGTLISAWMGNVITSFLVSACLIFVWILIGLDFVLVAIPSSAGGIVQQLSLLAHIQQINLGLFTLRDVSFFGIAIVLLLSLATIKLMEPKTSENPVRRRSLYVGAAMIAVVGIVVNQIFSEWRLQADLSRGQVYSLSAASKQTLSKIDDILSITLYTSRQLPPGQYLLIQQYAKDLLSDYERNGHGKVKLNIIYPESDPKYTSQAEAAGVRPRNFNNSSSGKLEIQTGYLGIGLTFADKTDSIDFITDPNNLEPELTRKIRKLTQKDAKTIGVVTGMGEKSEASNWKNLSAILTSGYELKDVTLDSKTDLSNTKALMIIGPSQEAGATASAQMTDYLAKGGSALFFLDRVAPNYQLGIGDVVKPGWDDVLKTYGLGVDANLVYDLGRPEQISLGNGPFRYAVSYPFWISSKTNSNFEPISGIDSVTLGWASSINMTATEGVTQTKLLSTTNDAGAMTSNFIIDPEKSPKTSENKEFVLGAAAAKGNSKVVLIGDSDLADDNFTTSKTANSAFVSNLLDWMAADSGELIVPRKDFTPAILDFQSPQQIMISEWGNLIGVPVLVAGYGIWHLRRRKVLSQRKWVS